MTKPAPWPGRVPSKNDWGQLTLAPSPTREGPVVTDSSDANAYLVAPPVNDSVSGGASHTSPADQAWAALAPLLAGRPRVRESRSGGHTYLRRWERPLTTRRPTVPAAIPLYSGAGDTKTLVIDLDTSRGGHEAVRRDAAALAALITRAGGRLIEDSSPTGGIHLYLPLQQPLGFHDARDLALALAARTPTMDPAPNQNLSDGLIRPPGAVHPRGGHQQLTGTLTRAYHLARTGNPPSVIGALQAALSAELQAQRDTARGEQAPTTAENHLPRLRGPRDLSTDYLRTATTGQYDRSRYQSPSEARQGVITAAVWAGLTLPHLIGRIEGGHWPGLASFYSRYRNPTTRRRALLADWRSALAWVTKQQATAQRMDYVRNSPTSQPTPHGGYPETSDRDRELRRGTTAEYQWIRSWWTAMRLLEHQRYTGRSGPGARWLLRALGEAAIKTGSRYIAFGSRSLSIATGIDHTTVAAHLRVLRSEPDPFIDLIENDRGLAGDLYTLRIPDEVADRAQRIAWPGGRLHGLRPVFHELGHVAATVYEALEHDRGPARSFDLTNSTGLSRTAIHTALRTLAAWNLIQQVRGRWTLVAGTSLTVLAEQFGCLDAIREQISKHRSERLAYRAALGQSEAASWPPPTVATSEHPPPLEPPPQETETLLELLQRELGAYPVPH